MMVVVAVVVEDDAAVGRKDMLPQRGQVFNLIGCKIM